jgi:hypothetical protein
MPSGYGARRLDARGGSRNAPADRYVVLSGSSRKLDLPEPVDVVVSDQLGAFICEGMPLPVIADAARRHLRPGGRLVPATLEFGVQALQSDAVDRHLAFWDRPSVRAGRHAAARHRSGHADLRAHSDRVAGRATGVARGAPGRRAPDTVDLRTSIRVDRSGPVNGLAGFVTAALTAGVTISTAPEDPSGSTARTSCSRSTRRSSARARRAGRADPCSAGEQHPHVDRVPGRGGAPPALHVAGLHGGRDPRG